MFFDFTKRGMRKPSEMSSSAWTRVRGDSDEGKSKLNSWVPMKNLFDAGNFGSISMKEASSDASMEALNDSARLSKDGFMFTNQLYEKLSMERVW